MPSKNLERRRETQRAASALKECCKKSINAKFYALTVITKDTEKKSLAKELSNVADYHYHLFGFPSF